MTHLGAQFYDGRTYSGTTLGPGLERPLAITVRSSDLVEPAAIMFLADPVPQSREWRDGDYLWDLEGCSKQEVGCGPCVARVFEAGTHTVTLDLNDGTETAEVEFTVASADATFPTTQTIVVSSSGTFTDAPAGATQVTSSDYNAVLTAHAANNRRILFRRGETFANASLATLNYSNVQIGAFGTAGTRDARGIDPNAPIIRSTYSDVPSVAGTNVKLYDLHADTTSGTPHAPFGLGVIQGLLFWRVQVDAGFNVAFGSDNTPTRELSRDVHVVDCSATDQLGITCYMTGRYVSVVNTRLANNDATHLLRWPWVQDAYCGYCDLYRQDPIRHAIKLHSEPPADMPDLPDYWWTERVFFDHNAVTSRGDWAVTIGPASGSDGYLSRVRTVVVDGMACDVESGTQVCVYVCAEKVSVRNVHAIDKTAADNGDVSLVRIVQRATAPADAPPINEIEVHHCSFYSASTARSNGLIAVEAYDHTGDVVVRNSWLYAPSITGPDLLTYTDDGTTFDVDGCLSTAVDPGVVSGTNMHLTVDGDAVDAGVETVVLRDFDRVVRDATPDAGAFEFGAATLVSIAVTPEDPSTALGLTRQFTATGTYSDESEADITDEVTWTSSDEDVATISNEAGTEGLALTLTEGETTIEAELGLISGDTTLTVTAAELVSIAVTPEDPSNVVGSTRQFTATGTYSDESEENITEDVTWTSDDEAVATISNEAGTEGLASTLTVGEATIAATLGDVVGESTLTVVAVALVSIAVTPEDPSTALGLTRQFTATGTYNDDSEADITEAVTWTSSDEDVATISNEAGTEGLASTLTEGETTIEAELGLISGDTTLTVTAAELVSLAVTPATPFMWEGDEVACAAIGTYSDSSEVDHTEDATWASDDELVATVSDVAGTKGLVLGIAAGDTVIIASYDGQAVEVPCAVRTERPPAATAFRAACKLGL